MLNYEKDYYNLKVQFIAGCDEAGRGPLAGPVVAAAVIMPRDFICEDVNDSKVLSESKRQELFSVIIKNAIACETAIIDSEEIDRINIYQASKKAMTLALLKINHRIDMVLTDAMPLKFNDLPVEAIIKGDAKSFNIACASIVAKVTRDNLMFQLDKQYPEYGFKNHKGYPTRFHIEAITTHGPIKGVHRFTFAPIKHETEQLKLF